MRVSLLMPGSVLGAVAVRKSSNDITNWLLMAYHHISMPREHTM